MCSQWVEMWTNCCTFEPKRCFNSSPLIAGAAGCVRPLLMLHYDPLDGPVAVLGGSRRWGGSRAAGMTRRPRCPTDAQATNVHTLTRVSL